MSAPPSGSSASGSPSAGYYPDPSIPGYIRYWDGTAWVPGTSRPEPRPGEPAPKPPVGATPPAAAGGPAPSGPSAASEETTVPAPQAPSDAGPAPADGSTAPTPPRDTVPAPRQGGVPATRQSAEVAPQQPGEATPGESAEVTSRQPGELRPSADAEATTWDDPRRLHGLAPGTAPSWQADSGERSPSGEGPVDPRVALGAGERSEGGAPAAADAASTVPSGSAAFEEEPRRAATGDESAEAASASTPAGASADASSRDDKAGTEQAASSPRTMAIRLPRSAPASDGRSATDASSGEAAGGAAAESGRPAAGGTAPGGPSATPGTPTPPARVDHTVGLRIPRPAPGAPASGTPTPGSSGAPASGAGAAPGTPGAPAPGVPAPGVPGQGGVPPQAPWAQQVHDLAQQAPGGGDGVADDAPAPWRPPTTDPFQQAAQRQLRPSGIGKRLVARLIDSLVVLGVTGGVAALFVGDAVDHVQGKIEAVEQAGVTRTVWLIDGTTGVHLAVVLATFLVLGLLYEVLPTATWGRTLGKRLCGLTVVDIEQQDVPGFGAALRRWLVHGVPSLLVVGVVGMLWGLFDRPWRQGWHDKVARTFVTGDSTEIRL